MKTLLLFPFLISVAFAQAPLPNIAPKTNVSHSLAWDASTTPGVTYVLRRGIASGRYDEMMNVTGLAYVWTNVPASMTNYYVATAKNAAGLESDYSNELSVDPAPRPAPPNLRTAVPLTVELQRREPGGEWASVLTLGPFYDRADHPAEEFRTVVKIGKPIQLLPE